MSLLFVKKFWSCNSLIGTLKGSWRVFARLGAVFFKLWSWNRKELNSG
jgi:hypothetical protein